MVRRSKRNRDAGISADDGNAMGLTEAFHPVSADGFTTAMPPVDEGDGSIIGEDVVVDEEGVFEEVDLGDGEVLDDEGLPAGESFPDEAVFEDFYAGRPLDADGADAADASPVPDAVSLGVVTADVAPTKPASKAAHGAKKGDGASRGRHAKHASEMNEKARKKAELPEYMRKSRRMRRILIVVIILLVLILAAMVYFGVQLYKEASSSAVQQALSSEQEVAAIASEDATDSADAAKVTTVPDLVSLLGHTQQEAIDILQHATHPFEHPAVQGEDLFKEHEKYLTEEHFKSPVFVYDWPKEIKAFYMYQNDDGKTVRGVDLLVPGSGELMGGSERETRLDLLTGRMDELHISKEQMDWYVNLRRFGGCTHSGFGMGFERLIMYLTDIENIRDVIPYPRTPGNCEF